MDEASICTIIKNSINNQVGYCSKIPDPTGQYSKTIQRPFDLFGVINGKPFYSEVKYMGKLKSFDLSRIEDHQIENLMNIKSLLPESICAIILGIHVGRGDTRIYIFNNIEEIAKRRINKQNFLKKELENIPYLSVKKSEIDITNYVLGV